jgi:hypothetical protein
MIKVLMFDLGDTLIDAQRRPFPQVPEALAVIGQLKTAAGRPLRSCLVSDFTLATPPLTSAKVAALFAQYLAVLDATGLRPFFEPVKKRVTLSTHVGVLKPERAIFEKALRRLGVTATLEECLLITENGAHVKAVGSQLHMRALQFRAPGTAHGDFDDWADAPALIAQEVAPGRADNPGVVAVSARAAGTGGQAIEAAGQVWYPISIPGHDDLQDLYVAVPVTHPVSRGARGTRGDEPPADPSDADIAEVTNFVRGLVARGQVGGVAGSETAHPTHRVETDAQGVKRLVRARYSAV